MLDVSFGKMIVVVSRDASKIGVRRYNDGNKRSVNIGFSMA